MWSLLQQSKASLDCLLTHPFRYLLGNPIPFIPFPLIRGRGISYIREASPLFDSPFRERERDFREGLRPSLTYTSPFP